MLRAGRTGIVCRQRLRSRPCHLYNLLADLLRNLAVRAKEGIGAGLALALALGLDCVGAAHLFHELVEQRVPIELADQVAVPQPRVAKHEAIRLFFGVLHHTRLCGLFELGELSALLKLLEELLANLIKVPLALEFVDQCIRCQLKRLLHIRRRRRIRHTVVSMFLYIGQVRNR